jgi:adenylate cyclase
MGQTALEGSLQGAAETGTDRTARSAPPGAAGLAAPWEARHRALAALPARVGAEIARREAAAERTIGWAQLTLVLFFGLLFSIAPRAEGAEMKSLVPATLLAYGLFTVVRLALSYRRTLPDWFLMLSILVDVGLLCGLIFSFHTQYGQPPAFYLKAPTILYFFIFISMRALRFDPRFVLVAGLASAAGWLALVAYAVLSDMDGMSITRNFVEYLTSNAILIGAEVDKTVTLLSVTLILAFALYRARAVLLDAIAARSAADDLSHFFAPDVARSITAAETMPMSGQSQVREAAILFLDVRGFTPIAAGMEPAAVMEVLGRYQQGAIEAVTAYGGQIDKYLGDGILATFGAVRDSKTPAADALRAAVAAIEAIELRAADFASLGWPGAFRVGAGVAAGPVTAGVVGAEGRLEFTVIGDAVNRAAKFENANKALASRVVTDAATFGRATAQGFAGDGARHLPQQVVPGLPAPADLVVLA